MEQALARLAALRELTMRAKMTEANRLYSAGGMWKYCTGVFGSSEGLLDRLRIALHGRRHRWPYGTKAQKRYILSSQFAELEEMTYELKAVEARRLFKRERAMLRYLKSLYGRTITEQALIAAIRRGPCG